MFTKSSVITSVILLLIVVGGMVIIMNGMNVAVNVSLPGGQNCWDQLNAAGQVVGSFCQ